MAKKLKKVYGNHLGIVVNNNDPENRGRVQVFIPYLSNTIYSGWNSELKDFSFSHIDTLGAFSPELLIHLKTVLPWSECAAPVFGGGTSALFNPGTGSTSSNPLRTFSGKTTGASRPNVNYAYGSSTNRNLPVADELVNNLSDAATKVYGKDAKVIIYSGTQNPDREQVSNTGRHDGGLAADVYIEKDGKLLSGSELAPFVQYWASLGNTGIGYGMSGGSGLHLDLVGNQLGGGRFWTYNGLSNSDVSQAFANGSKGVAPSGLAGSLEDPPSQSPARTAGVEGADTMVAGKDLYAQEPAKTEYVPQGTFTTTVFNYSLGKGVIGNQGDETQDVNTNNGKSAFAQNLTPGVVARAREGGTANLPYGTVIRDTSTNFVYIIADNHGNQNQNAIDVYVPTSQYNINNTQNNVTFEILGRESTIGRSAGEVRQQLSKYGQVPPGPSATEEFASVGKNNLIEGSKGFASAGDGRTYGSLNFAGTPPYPNSLNHGNGMFALPQPGAKVFVFFLNGDVQKPIYFACAPEPSAMQNFLQTANGPDSSTVERVNQNQINQTTSMAAPGGQISIGYAARTSSQPPEKTFIRLTSDQGADAFLAESISLASPTNASVNARGDMFLNSVGPMNLWSGGFIEQGTDGDITLRAGLGTNPDERRKAAEEINNMIKSTHNKKLEEIKNNAPKGDMVPCPICSTTYVSDAAKNLAKRFWNFIKKWDLPWGSYAIEFLSFVTSLLLVPFLSIVPAKTLLKDGTCGNEGCKDGMIPSPQKPIEDANKKAGEEMAKNSTKIQEAETRMGAGGTITMAAAKDFVINAGLTTNDAEAYTQAGHNTDMGGFVDGKNTPTYVMRGGKNHERMVHSEPDQFPGGNIVLKGGNKVKIVSGSPGLDMVTKGKISITGGGVNVVGSEGEVVLSSKNKTIVKGKSLTLEADDRSGKGSVQIYTPQTIIKGGFSVAGDAVIKGGLGMDGELSVKYINTVGQRVQTSGSGTPDQRVPQANWAVGPAQAINVLNLFRTTVTHYAFLGAIIMPTNIVKAVMDVLETITLNSVIEPVATGIYFGGCLNAAGPGVSWGFIWNWRHNHNQTPQDHHHDFTQPRGTYYDDDAGLAGSRVNANPVPTPARKNGTAPDGGPKTLAGCGGGGFGFGTPNTGGGPPRFGNLNSFGLTKLVPGFNNIRLNNPNIKFTYTPDGNVEPLIVNRKLFQDLGIDC